MRNKFLSLLMSSIALLCLGAMPVATAATPILMVLEHLEQGHHLRMDVEAKAGEAVSPTRGKGFDKWALLPGNPLVVDAQPTDITVELFRGTPTQGVRWCTVTIRYYRDARGVWVPHYRLDQEAFVARGKDGRWLPFAAAGTSLIVLTSSTLPNADGFYPSLEFIPSSDLLQIDSWVVR